MKHLQNSTKTISIFDDEKTFGTLGSETGEPEQHPTAPVVTVVGSQMAHPLRGLLNSALGLMASNEEREILGEETDAYADHLIPLTDEDDEHAIGEGHFAVAASFIQGIAQSLTAEHDEDKTPLLLAAFRSRFLG